MVSLLPGIDPEVNLLGHVAHLTFQFSTNHQALPQRGCVILHSRPQYGVGLSDSCGFSECASGVDFWFNCTLAREHTLCDFNAFNRIKTCLWPRIWPLLETAPSSLEKVTRCVGGCQRGRLIDSGQVSWLLADFLSLSASVLTVSVRFVCVGTLLSGLHVDVVYFPDELTHFCNTALCV